MSQVIRSFVHNGGKDITAGQPQYYGPSTIKKKVPQTTQPAATGATSLVEAERRQAAELTAQGWTWGGLAGGWRPPNKNATYTPSAYATYVPPKYGSMAGQPQMSSYSLRKKTPDGKYIMNQSKFGAPSSGIANDQFGWGQSKAKPKSPGLFSGLFG